MAALGAMAEGVGQGGGMALGGVATGAAGGEDALRFGEVRCQSSWFLRYEEIRGASLSCGLAYWPSVASAAGQEIVIDVIDPIRLHA